MKSWSSIVLVDPSLAWLGGPYGEAFAALSAGTGLLVLTGEIGTGKTTVANALAQSFLDEGGLVGTLFYPSLEPLDFLRAVAHAYRLPTELTTRDAFHAELRELVRRAATEGRRVVFVVDEAQSLGGELLDEIERLMASVSDEARPSPAAPHEPGVAGLGSFSVLLVGQESLESTLADPAHTRLAQRIGARYRLRPMNEDEVAAYVDHRLTATGVDGVRFTRAAIAEIHRASEGLPRLVDSIAERAAVRPVQRSVSRWLEPLGLGSLVRVGRGRVAGRVAAMAAREELSDRRPRRDDETGNRRYAARVVALAASSAIVLGFGWIAVTHLPGQPDAWRSVWRSRAMPSPPATTPAAAPARVDVPAPQPSRTAPPARLEPSAAQSSPVAPSTADASHVEKSHAVTSEPARPSRVDDSPTTEHAPPNSPADDSAAPSRAGAALEQPASGVAARSSETPSASPGPVEERPSRRDVRSPAVPRPTRSTAPMREVGVARPALKTAPKRPQPATTETDASGAVSGRATEDRESAPDPSAVIDWLLDSKR
jgi:type II secretory pathway predicted ATPase ExeA